MNRYIDIHYDTEKKTLLVKLDDKELPRVESLVINTKFNNVEIYYTNDQGKPERIVW